MKIKRLTMGAMFLGIALLLPQLVHMTGIARSGELFLPMHFPVLLAGLVLGPIYGLLIGVVAPLLSFLMTGMPPITRLPFMVGEVAMYGLISGLMYQTFQWYKKPIGIWVSLLFAMISGRVFYAFLLFGAAGLLGFTGGGPQLALAATIQGIYGIILQLVILPPLIFALRKGGVLDEFIGTGSCAS